MSAAMDLSTNSAIIHVKLLDELVDVWRPVSAKPDGIGLYQIEHQSVPEFELWEFLPGDVVEVSAQTGPEGQFLAAMRKVNKREIHDAR